MTHVTGANHTDVVRHTPVVGYLTMRRWDPKRAAEQRQHLDVWYTDLANCRGLIRVEYGRRVILVERSLGPRARRCVLGHELIHDERDLLYDCWTPERLVSKEERAVDLELARRLVPPFELMGFVRRRSTVGPVTVAQVVEEFDVTGDVAEMAMRIVEDGLAA